MATDDARLKDALNGIDYPATKEQLIAQATRNQADPDTLKALCSIQPEWYANIAEVRAATPMAAGQSEAEKTQQKRQHTKDTVTESAVATPNNPIVEELGENRGS
jgi:succinylarginine dihydrolase